MKKTKKAISLILAFAMVFTAMLGCMTISASAAEGQAGAGGPVITGFNFENVEGPATGEPGQTIKLNITFDKNIKVTDQEKALDEI